MRRLRGLIAGALLLAASPGGTGGTQSPQDKNAPFTLRSEVDAHKIGVQDPLQLTITGSAILDANGRGLDGGHNGQPGSNYQATLG